MSWIPCTTFLTYRGCSLSYRQANAPHLFLGAFQPPRTLLGYVVSTLSTSPTLTHSSMSSHDPTGTSVCIHSVAVTPTHQRRGIALALLKTYVSRLEETADVERALLITHEELRPLYAKAGFAWIGKSAVVHGARDWFEMRVEFGGGASSLPPNVSQHALLDALSTASTSSRAKAKSAAPRAASSFASLADLVVEIDGGEKANKYKIVCLREGCGSLILMAKTAAFREAPSVSVSRPSLILVQCSF